MIQSEMLPENISQIQRERLVHTDVGNPDTSRSRRQFRWMMVLGILLAVILVPYLITRIGSFGERVRVFRNPAADRNASTDSIKMLRVMTWNIAHGRGIADSNWAESAKPKVSRVLQIAHLIKQQQADIVVLNEVDFSATWSGKFDQAKAIAEASGFPYFARQSNLDFGVPFLRLKFGNVVLSRFPIQQASSIDLPPHQVWEDWLAGRKRGLFCTLDVGGDALGVMALHLESRGSTSRVRAAHYLVDRITGSELPLIVAGDLNTTPSLAQDRDPQYWSFDQKLKENAFDILATRSGLAHVPKAVVDASQFTFPAIQPVAAIDWVFYDKSGFEPAKHQVLQTELSDHLPVVVDFLRRR